MLPLKSWPWLLMMRKHTQRSFWKNWLNLKAVFFTSIPKADLKNVSIHFRERSRKQTASHSAFYSEKLSNFKSSNVSICLKPVRTQPVPDPLRLNTPHVTSSPILLLDGSTVSTSSSTTTSTIPTSLSTLPPAYPSIKTQNPQNLKEVKEQKIAED